MGVRQARLTIIAFFLLSAGVAVNLLVFQADRHAVAAKGPLAADSRAGDGSRADQIMKLTRSPGAEHGETPAADGDLVIAIQRELQQRGYDPGAVDGVLTIVARAAIMAFEHDHRLPLTGEPSQPLLNAIVLGVTPAVIQALAGLAKDNRQPSDHVIRTVQQSLAGLGYNPGRAAGRFGEETSRAIRQFEADQGLAATGRISGPLVARLARAGANGRGR